MERNLCSDITAIPEQNQASVDRILLPCIDSTLLDDERRRPCGRHRHYCLEIRWRLETTEHGGTSLHILIVQGNWSWYKLETFFFSIWKVDWECSRYMSTEMALSYLVSLPPPLLPLICIMAVHLSTTAVIC